MTAFDEILKAEQAALTAIETAKAETAEAIATAKKGHQLTITEQEAKLETAGAEAISAHQSHLKTMTDKIESAVATEVANVTKKFTAEADGLKKEVTQHFAQ